MWIIWGKGHQLDLVFYGSETRLHFLMFFDRDPACYRYRVACSNSRLWIVHWEFSPAISTPVSWNEHKNFCFGTLHGMGVGLHVQTSGYGLSIRDSDQPLVLQFHGTRRKTFPFVCYQSSARGP
ncbi:unnamed protein product [Lactuca virosa]|uniref:Uncharacterized protein n=1 Tax=Lactuca virosa TaxID=75947 RepID=A0AAU9MN21_9ASTR|nr:unnamed protein product [Lactuca virosa]